MRFRPLNLVLASYLIGTFCHLCSGQILDPELQGLQSESSSVTGEELVLHRTAKTTSSRRSTRDVTWTAALLLRADSQASTPTERLQSALSLIEMFGELQTHPRMRSSASLQLARKKLLVRLRAIKKRTASDVRRRKRKPERIDIDQGVLAQLNQAARNIPAVPGNQANGPNANQDYGTLLVNLIQRTVSPNSWDVNGGLSSIQYWQPRRALVVRAPQAVHDNLSPLLLQLRKQ